MCKTGFVLSGGSPDSPVHDAYQKERERSLMARRAIIIDTDAGIDDAQGLAMAFHPSSGVDILGVVCCQGNTTLDNVVGNVCAIMDAWDVDLRVPVYRGASVPLLSESSGAAEWHGRDGLGETSVGFTGNRARVAHGVPGAIGLATLAKRHLETTGSRADMILLGPMTDLALALRLYPELIDSLGCVYAMGGATDASGNVTHTAEYNVYADPEAAAIVLSTVPNLTLVTWELTLKYPLTRAFVDQEWLPAIEDLSTGRCSSRARWLRRVSEYLLAHPSSASEVLIPDPLCVAIALWPSEIIAGSYRARVGVELGGSHCRGMTWVDRKAVGPAANVTVVSSLVMEAVRSALVRSVTA